MLYGQIIIDVDVTDCVLPILFQCAIPFLVRIVNIIRMMLHFWVKEIHDIYFYSAESFRKRK